MTSSKISSAPAAVTGLPQPFEEPGHRGDQAHVGGDRLDDTHATSSSSSGTGVVGDHDRVGHRRRGTPADAGEPEGGHPAAAAGQQPVAVAVVAAGEQHDPVPPGRAAGQADCRHGRLGPAGDQPHLRSRDPGADAPRPAAPRPRWGRRRSCPPAAAGGPPRPPPGGHGRGSRHRRTGRSRASGCPRHPRRRRPRPGPRSRGAADRPERPHRRVDPAGDTRRPARTARVDSHRVSPRRALGYLAGEVGEYQVGAGPLDRRHAARAPPPIRPPAPLGGGRPWRTPRSRGRRRPAVASPPAPSAMISR